MFQKATKQEARARIALIGPSGAGKTWSSLMLATELAEGKPFAVLDTESGSAAKYSDQFAFDVVEVDDFKPANFFAVFGAARDAGYPVLVVDSLTHFWKGPNGILEQVDLLTQSRYKGNSMQAWKEGNAMHQQELGVIVRAPFHVICTMRSKTAYETSQDDRGKLKMQKIGLAPEQREGVEYEFDLVGNFNNQNGKVLMEIGKTRCSDMQGVVAADPTTETFQPFLKWLRGTTTS